MNRNGFAPIAIVLVIVIVIALGGGAFYYANQRSSAPRSPSLASPQAIPQPSTTLPDGWNLYRNKNLGVTIKYPAQFLLLQSDYAAKKVTDISGQDILLSLASSSGFFHLSIESQYTLPILKGSQKLYGENDLDTFYQILVASNPSKRPEEQYPPEKIVTIGNVKGLDISVHFSGLPDRRTVFILKNGLVYLVEYSPAQNPDFQAIVSTLHIDDIPLLPAADLYSSPTDLSTWKTYPDGGRNAGLDAGGTGITFQYPPEVFGGFGFRSYDAVYEAGFNSRMRSPVYNIFALNKASKNLDRACKRPWFFPKLDCSPFGQLTCDYVSDGACVSYYGQDHKGYNKDGVVTNFHQWIKQVVKEQGDRRAYLLAYFDTNNVPVSTGKMTDDALLASLSGNSTDNQKELDLFNAMVKSLKFVTPAAKQKVDLSLNNVPRGQQGSEMSARNETRLSDVNKIATALGVYYGDNNAYPNSLSQMVPAYLSSIPVAPKAAQVCSDADNTYTYVSSSSNSYAIGFCLEMPYFGGPYAAGPHVFTSEHSIK